MTAGLYLLRVNNFIYVGCSNNIERRIKRHKKELESNVHHNKRLQRSFTKNENFNWFLLAEEPCESKRFELEVKYIASLKQNYSFVVNDTDGGDRGPVARGQDNCLSASRRTPEMVRKMKENRKPKYGIDNSFYGKKHKEETLQKLRNANSGKRFSEKTEFKSGHSIGNKPVQCIQTGAIYSSAKEAGLALNIAHYTITHTARSGGTCKQGYSFKYLENK